MRTVVIAVVGSILSGVLSACATGPVDPNADNTPRDRTITTGSNIPRKGQAVVVDKSALDNQRDGAGAGAR